MVLQGVNELALIPGCYFQCPLLQGMFSCIRVLLFWNTQPWGRPAWELSRFLGIVFWNQQKTFLHFSRVKLGWAVISCYTRGLSGEKSCCKCIKQKHDLSCHFVCPCCQGLSSISPGGTEQLASSCLSPVSKTHHPAAAATQRQIAIFHPASSAKNVLSWCSVSPAIFHVEKLHWERTGSDSTLHF